jgi:four helix bundle protein
MGNRINNFEQLEAWRVARELVRLIYSSFRRKPASMDFGLRNQMQRAAVSAMTNVAEGFERVHSAEKLQFYNVARASCGEVRSLSYVMSDASYITDSEHEEILSLVAQAGRLISGLIRSTRSRSAISQLPTPIS